MTAWAARTKRRAPKGWSVICFAGRRESIALRFHASRKPGVTNPWLPVERMRSTRGGCVLRYRGSCPFKTLLPNRCCKCPASTFTPNRHSHARKDYPPNGCAFWCGSWAIGSNHHTATVRRKMPAHAIAVPASLDAVLCRPDEARRFDPLRVRRRDLS